MSISKKEMYHGKSQEEIQKIEREVESRYSPEIIAESNRNIQKLSRDEWKSVLDEGERIASEVAGLMTRPADDPNVQALVARHHRWIENFYQCSPEIYRGLADLYVTDDRFREYYDKYATGLADFMKKAMLIYSDSLE